MDRYDSYDMARQLTENREAIQRQYMTSEQIDQLKQYAPNPLTLAHIKQVSMTNSLKADGYWTDNHGQRHTSVPTMAEIVSKGY